MNKHQDRKTRIYDPVFKMKVILAVLKENLGYAEAAQLFEITNESTVRGWVKNYKGNSLPLTIDYKSIMPTKEQEPEKSNEELTLELQALKKELAQEKLRNKVLNTLIDYSEEEFNIDIRKKRGTKRSK